MCVGFFLKLVRVLFVIPSFCLWNFFIIIVPVKCSCVGLVFPIILYCVRWFFCSMVLLLLCSMGYRCYCGRLYGGRKIEYVLNEIYYKWGIYSWLKRFIYKWGIYSWLKGFFMVKKKKKRLKKVFMFRLCCLCIWKLCLLLDVNCIIFCKGMILCVWNMGVVNVFVFMIEIWD